MFRVRLRPLGRAMPVLYHELCASFKTLFQLAESAKNATPNMQSSVIIIFHVLLAFLSLIGQRSTFL